MRIVLLTVLLTMLTLTTSAEEITTGNLLPNGTGSASNLQSVDTTIPNVQSNCSSFTSVNTTCTNSNWNYQEVEVGSTSSGTGTLNYTGDLVGVTTGNETSTQAMLDNGVVLNSTTVVQNCEWTGSAHQCGQARPGQDQFKTTVKILDSDGNVLSQTDQIRNTDSGYYSNADKYTDQVIYSGTGSNQFDWTWTGIDNGSSLVDLGGPNLLGAKLTMTYNNTVIANEIVEEISEIFEELQEEIFEEFTFEEIEEIFEEMVTFFTEPSMEMEEEFEEITFEPMLTFIEEEIIEEIIMEEEMLMEEMPIEEEMVTSFFTMMAPQEEEIYEETKEIIANFLPMVSKEEETFTEEDELTENGPVRMEPTEEESKEEVIKEKSTQMAEEEAVEEEPTKMVEATNEEKKEEIKEEKPDSETPKKSTVQTKKLAKQKVIQQKKAIVKNLARIMDKVDKDIKDISKNLAVKNIIKMEAMTSEQVSLNAYANTQFYKPKNIYLEQLPIFDSRLIYADKSLATYIQNDKMEIKARKLGELNLKKQQLLNELEVLKNGQT